MGFLIGLLIAAGALISAAVHLNQEAHHFWDFVGFVSVIGGTFAVAVITIPWQHRRLIFRSLIFLIVPKKGNDTAIVGRCIEFITTMRNGNGQYQGKADDLAGETLRDGAELLSLGFGREKVHEILEERIHQWFERTQQVSNSFRSLAKYPPAFGLAGTVLGLITLMRKVSEGADAKETGVLMAIALMATFYGILVANLLINPAGEHMTKTALAERKNAEIALNAVLLHADGASLLEAQEVLNSYVVQSNRVNVMIGVSEAA